MDDKRLRAILDGNMEYEEAIEVLGNKPVFEQGNIVHEAAEMFFDTGLKPTLLNCPKSSREFFKYLSSVEAVHVEKFFYNDTMKYGGRVDLIHKRAGLLRLADYKTVATVKKKPEVSWLMQMGAYYEAAVENDIYLQGAEIVQFSKKDLGVFTLEISVGDMKVAADKFIKARDLFTYWYNI